MSGPPVDRSSGAAASGPLTRAERVAALADDEGRFTVVAADHRDSLRMWLDPAAPDAIEAELLEAIKIDLVASLGARASGVLLDPEYGLDLVRAARVLPAGCGTIVSLEAQGYFSDPAGGTSLMDDWGVGPAKEAGATATKMLVLTDPVSGEPSDAQVDVVREVLADCDRHGMPLFLEPIAPGAAPEDRRQATVRGAEVFAALRPDVLKLAFPVDTAVDDDRGLWQDACEELNEAAGGPWTLLSGGGTVEAFAEQLAVAGTAGCSGFLVGRALWGDAVKLDGPARRAALDAEVVPRLDLLIDVVARTGRGR